MVNEDILGGIETAFAKGETFESAMMSFYNSGYSKEDIEWAAKAFQMNQFRAGPEKKIQIRPTGAVPLEPPKEVASGQFMKKPYIRQNVSNYEQASQFQERVILFILIAAFVLLLGILAGVFVFKERLVNFINNLFSG